MDGTFFWGVPDVFPTVGLSTKVIPFFGYFVCFCPVFRLSLGYPIIGFEERVVSDCPFCSISKHDIVAESDLCVAFYDQFPVHKGHVLIVPKRHVESYFDLTSEEIADMHKMLFDMKNVVQELHHPDGFNIGVNVGEMAGQSIFHVHMHLIPRYAGDVEYPRGGVRGVIPEMQNY